jgi:transposase
VDHNQQEQIALHRWAVIAEAAGDKLTARERGALVRQIAARAHPHPDGSSRTYSRGSIDRWLRAWRRGGLAALKPAERADTGMVRAHPELFAEAAALRLELPGRSAAQIASILYHRHGITVSERTVRGQLRRAGLHREALAAEPKAYGRYEAARPNERWITDVLAGPWVPWPRRDGSVRARLFLIVDDHSRLLVDGRFSGRENARACQDLLRRAITRRGLPQVFYADNGAPFFECVAGPDLRRAGHKAGAFETLLAGRAGETGEAEPLYPGGVPGRGRPPGYRVPGRAERPVRRVGRAGRQPAGARRDRPDANRPVRGRRPAPSGRPGPDPGGVPVVSDPPGDPHRDRPA